VGELFKTLEPPDNFLLSAAEGWLGLGDAQSALAELDQIQPHQGTHLEVLLVLWRVHSELKQWDRGVEAGQTLVEVHPELVNGWILRSFALHELKQTHSALSLLLPAFDNFPGSCTIPYNLACYCAQLNQLDDARAWLKKAAAANHTYVRLNAKTDPDLIPLRDSLDEIL